jgi:tRNA pseudouridine55 synthase
MDGVLVIDKPQGLTSHDVVAVARRALREPRIGHTGTLDPLATGVLPLAIGRATRLVRFLTASDKDYVATIRFGATTDSYDADGEQTSHSDRHPERPALEAAVTALRGSYDQMPPPFSAKKVGGQRAYDLARRKEDVVLTPVPVSVLRADVVAFDGWTAQVALTCSAGFYVRSFAHALGQAVGTGAYLEALQRTRSGEFHLEEALALDALAEISGRGAAGRGQRTRSGGPEALDDRRETAADWIIPIDGLLTGVPAVTVTDEGQLWLKHGRELGPGQLLSPAPCPLPPGGWLRLVDRAGHLMAMATPGSQPGSLHPSVVLN